MSTKSLYLLKFYVHTKINSCICIKKQRCGKIKLCYGVIYNTKFVVLINHKYLCIEEQQMLTTNKTMIC
jgi:hypothetical protein